ncbi:MAG: lysophospholipid acyltransferase family protein [Pseudomonadota bacterium]
MRGKGSTSQASENSRLDKTAGPAKAQRFSGLPMQAGRVVPPNGGKPQVRFTYSTPEQPPIKRAVIRSIELLGGQRRLRKLYESTQTDRMKEETFFDSALRYLAIDVRFDTARLALAPKDGPVIFIANHPYGVLDGITLTWLCMQVRPDVKVLANSVLCRIPEARDNLLPIDFADTKEAMETTLQSRLASQKWLAQGRAIGIFPGGGISTAARPLRGPALDLPWAPFLAKLVRASKATVVPVYFSGQNSRMFQLASHMSQTLRLSLMFRETARRIGTRLDVAVGEPIPYDALAHLNNRADMLDVLRRSVFSMAPDNGIDWMMHGRLKAS